MPIDFQPIEQQGSSGGNSTVAFQPDANQPSQPNPQGSGIKGFLGNVGSDIKNAGGAFFHAIAHPIETAKSVGKLAVGAVMPAVAGAPTSEQDASHIASGVSGPQKAAASMDNYIQTKYGSIAAFRKSLYETPVQTMLDLSTVVSGMAGAAGKLGAAADFTHADALAGALTKASEGLKTASEVTNPAEAAAKLAGGAVSKTNDVLSKERSFAPFAGKVDESTLNLAKETGVDLPASAVSDSKAVNFIETLGRRGIFGDKLQGQVEEAINGVNNYAKGIVDDIGKSSDLTTAGTKMAEGATQFRSDFFKIKNDLYAQAEIPPAGAPKAQQIFVDTKPALKTLDEAIAREKLATKGTGQQGDLPTLQAIRNGLEKKNMTLAEARAKLQFVNGKTEFGTDIAHGTQGTLRAVGGTLSDQIDAAISKQRPDLKEALDNANDFYKYGNERINSAYGQKILENKDRPDVIMKDVILSKSTSASDIPNIYDMIGPDAQENVQAAFLQKMFDDVKVGDNGRISGAKLSNYMGKTIGDEKLKAILTDQQYGDVQKLQQLSSALDKSQKLGEGSQTAFLVKTTAETLTTLGSLFTGNIHGFMVGLSTFLGDAALSKLIASPMGQELLTTGTTFKLSPEWATKAANVIAPALAGGGSKARAIEEAGNIDENK